jgi:hypothetical protein
MECPLGAMASFMTGLSSLHSAIAVLLEGSAVTLPTVSEHELAPRSTGLSVWGRDCAGLIKGAEFQRERLMAPLTFALQSLVPVFSLCHRDHSFGPPSRNDHEETDDPLYADLSNSHRGRCCSAWDLPQIPVVMPAKAVLPEPLHAEHTTVLWPWHLGHNVLVGIARPSRFEQ